MIVLRNKIYSRTEGSLETRMYSPGMMGLAKLVGKRAAQQSGVKKQLEKNAARKLRHAKSTPEAKQRLKSIRKAIRNNRFWRGAAKVKTKYDSLQLKAANPIYSTAQAVHGTTKFIAQQPVRGTLATPVSTAITTNVLNNAGMDLAAAVPAAEVITLTGAAGLNKVVGGGRNFLVGLGRRLSKSNNKDTSRLGYRIVGGVGRLRRFNKGYKNAVGAVFDNPGSVIKKGAKSMWKEAKNVYYNPIPSAKSVTNKAISIPGKIKRGFLNTAQTMGDVAVVGTRPARQFVVTRSKPVGSSIVSGIKGLKDRAVGYVEGLVPQYRPVVNYSW